MTRIDVHTHILPPPRTWPDLSVKFGYAGWIALEEVASKGARGCGCARMVRVEQGVDGRVAFGSDGKRATTFFREIESNCWDPGARLADMARFSGENTSGESMAQVLSTVPVMFGYWARPEHTLGLSRWLNDHLAGVCRDHPKHFAALGTIPMNAPSLAVKELERCVRDLGMAGVQIGTNVNGRNLGEPEFFEVFAAAQELNACVFVHPWEMLCPPPAALPHPSPPAMSPRLAKHWAAWLVGMPAETCLSLCSIIFSGLLEELPKLRIGFAHGGGSFPGTIGRIDHGFHARPDLCQTHTKTSPRRHARSADGPARFYVDSLVHDATALGTLIEIMGPDRIMLGSDYPFPLGEDNPGELIDAMQHLPEPTRSQMLRDTAIEFLGPAAKPLLEHAR